MMPIVLSNPTRLFQLLYPSLVFLLLAVTWSFAGHQNDESYPHDRDPLAMACSESSESIWAADRCEKNSGLDISSAKSILKIK